MLRVAIIGGAPAGSFFALYALKYARLSGQEVALTIYECKDFGRPGPAVCNMCAGLIPAHVVRQLAEIDLVLPAGLLLGRIRHHALHTWAGTIEATRPMPQLRSSVFYRGAGPCVAPRDDLLSFDQFLLDQTVASWAVLRRSRGEAVRRDRPVEITTTVGRARL